MSQFFRNEIIKLENANNEYMSSEEEKCSNALFLRNNFNIFTDKLMKIIPDGQNQMSYSGRNTDCF